MIIDLFYMGPKGTWYVYIFIFSKPWAYRQRGGAHAGWHVPLTSLPLGHLG